MPPQLIGARSGSQGGYDTSLRRRMVAMQENTELGRPNTMQTGGIIRKMQPDVENTTPLSAGGLLTKKRVHYEGDALNKSA